MRPGIEQGKRAFYSEEVTEEMKPLMPGMIDHPVYSTWAMIRAMEAAARKFLQPYLERDKGEDAVGIEVSVRHLAPTPIGKIVKVTADFEEMKGAVLTCRLEVFYGKKKIGEGTHKQFIMSGARYKKFLKQVVSNGNSN